MRVLKVIAIMLLGSLSGALLAAIIAAFFLPHVDDSASRAPGDGIHIMLGAIVGLVLSFAFSIVLADKVWRREFHGWSVLCLLAGLGFLLLSLVGWLALRDVGFLLVGPAILFAGVANSLAFLVLERMRSMGREVGFWRTPTDLHIYREYWRIAPDKGWSRFPLVGFMGCFILAALFLLSIPFSGTAFFK